MKLSNYVQTTAETFAKRAEAIFERYDFKWAGKTFGAPDYIPDKTEILNRTYYLIDCGLEYLDEHPELKTCRISTGRIVVHVFRPRSDATELGEVYFSLDII
jgi:hypothetical protein